MVCEFAVAACWPFTCPASNLPICPLSSLFCCIRTLSCSCMSAKAASILQALQSVQYTNSLCSYQSRSPSPSQRSASRRMQQVSIKAQSITVLATMFGTSVASKLLVLNLLGVVAARAAQCRTPKVLLLCYDCCVVAGLRHVVCRASKVTATVSVPSA